MSARWHQSWPVSIQPRTKARRSPFGPLVMSCLVAGRWFGLPAQCSQPWRASSYDRLLKCCKPDAGALSRSARRNGCTDGIGASRARLVRQLLTESLCYGVLSGGFGVLLALAGVQLLAKTLPATGIFVASKTRHNRPALCAVHFPGHRRPLWHTPALAASRAGVAGVLNEARTAGRSARRVSVANTLLVGQVALSFLLLVTAALFLRSIQRAYGSTRVQRRSSRSVHHEPWTGWLRRTANSGLLSNSPRPRSRFTKR